MKLSRAVHQGWAAAPAGMLVLALLAAAAPAVAQSAGQTLLAPTPLILKDGRIANVSVHVLPFRDGAVDFAPGALGSLSRVVAEVATDCFLTAQVIGHVSPQEVGETDTLGAHRLARSRADSVQASLIEGGLPAKSIASVWDWQFLVRESRATLWVFRLTEGEECEGDPLAPGSAALVAEAPAVPEPETLAGTPAPAVSTRGTGAQNSPGSAPPPVVARAEPMEQREPPRATASVSSTPSAPAGDAPAVSPRASKTEVAADRPRAPKAEVAAAPAPSRSASVKQAAASEAPEPAPTAAANSAARKVTAVPAGPAPASTAVPSVTQPIPAISRSTDGKKASAAAAPDDDEQQLAAIPVRKGPPEDHVGGPSTAITFATNSSYLPPGAGKELGATVAGVQAGKRYRVHLLASVSSSDRVVGANSAEEAALYNRWLAKRRLTRVQEWLESHLQGAELEIQPEFLAEDDSRRVLVRITPAS